MDDAPDAALSLSNIANYLDELGEFEAAAADAGRAVAIIASTLGLDHPRAAIPLSNYADLLNRLRRYPEAQEAARRALAVFERESDPDGLYVTYPLNALGISDIGLRRFQEALSPLERALRIREAKETIPARRGEVFFSLAQALTGAGPDPDHPDRALALVRRARDEYRRAPPTPATERELAAIERWLAAEAEAAGAPASLAPITQPG